MNFTNKEKKIIKNALLIRKTEEKLLALFKDGKVNGTVHTCVGQEFIGAALSSVIGDSDTIFSNHRGHGHFLGATDDVEGLIAEVMGKKSGASKGMGGSQHLFSDNFLSNGIQGGMMPIAAGYALTKKLSGNDSISILFVGDGTLGEGIFYETANIAAKWDLPLLIIVENNSYAQSTKMSSVISGGVAGRARAFNIEYFKADTWNWKDLIKTLLKSVKFVRKNIKPIILEIKTYRLNAHSKGDDNRDKFEIEKFRKKDPLNILLKKNLNFLSDENSRIQKRLDKAVSKANLEKDCQYSIENIKHKKINTWETPNYESDLVSNLIYLSLYDQFKSSENTLMIGEDIEGEYGGAFNVTKNLSLKFPDKIRNTPISEATITGIGTGAAMSGYCSVVEIMFGDFLSLCFDQIINHATKFCDIYGRKLNVPLLIRVPMGGKRGYGPTHSQSLEKYFLGIPNLDIIALNERISPRYLYNKLFSNITNPTLVIENKILYTRKLKTEPIAGFEVTESDEMYPTIKITPISNNPDLSLFCYGGILEEVEQAVEKVFYEEEILCEVICPAIINPLNMYPILQSIKKSRRLLIIEDGPTIASLGSEVIARIPRNINHSLIVERIGFEGIIPCSLIAEKNITPNSNNITLKILKMFNE